MTVPVPFDAHVHLRDGPILAAVAPHTASWCDVAVAMPNRPAILDAAAAAAYRDDVLAAAPSLRPLMTIKLTPATTPDLVLDAGRCPDLVAAKLYPLGATTASDDGVLNVEALAPVFDAMQEAGMVLCVHGEDPAAFVLDREAAYLGRVRWVVRNFPGLRVVLEHVTTREAVDFVREASVHVAATITVHHLLLTLDDVIGHGIRPHHFCYPVPKRPQDRAALVEAALLDPSGRFFLGTDSAPHLRHAKESDCGCAGVFSAPTALPLLAGLFCDEPAALARFASEAGRRFYRLPPADSTITLRRRPWVVPDELGGIVPLAAGRTLDWDFTPREAP